MGSRVKKRASVKRVWVEIAPGRQRLMKVGHKPQRAKPTVGAWNKPWRSRSLKCHPAQAREFTEGARAAGLTGVYYDKDGTLVCETRKQRALEIKRRGGESKLHDFDGGYGDG